MKLKMILAADSRGGIGKGDNLPWGSYFVFYSAFPIIVAFFLKKKRHVSGGLFQKLGPF